MKKIKYSTKNKHQNGAILVAALLLLLVMTFIGISAFRGSHVSEVMISNQRSTNVALRAAESALRDGESQIASSLMLPIPCDTNHCLVHPSGYTGTLSNSSQQWWLDHSSAYQNTMAGVANQPSYVIERLAFIPDNLSTEAQASGEGLYYYQVSAYGVGPTGTENRIVQSVYTTRYN